MRGPKAPARGDEVGQMVSSGPGWGLNQPFVPLSGRNGSEGPEGPLGLDVGLWSLCNDTDVISGRPPATPTLIASAKEEDQQWVIPFWCR